MRWAVCVPPMAVVRYTRYVPNRLGVLVTQTIEADFLYAPHALFDSFFYSVCNFLISASPVLCPTLYAFGPVLILISTPVWDNFCIPWDTPQSGYGYQQLGVPPRELGNLCTLRLMKPQSLSNIVLKNKGILCFVLFCEPCQCRVHSRPAWNLHIGKLSGSQSCSTYIEP
jgi:hypothetical protein